MLDFHTAVCPAGSCSLDFSVGKIGPDRVGIVALVCKCGIWRVLGYRQATGDGDLKKVAFDLYQATKHLCHAVLLVLALCMPHVHNLAFLRTQAERLDRRLQHVWPMETRRDRARFEKLKDAYVKARYSKHYRISEEELERLGAQFAVIFGERFVICCR